MSKWTVLLTFLSIFINSALFGVIDNSIDQYSIKTESGETECRVPEQLVQEIADYQETVNKIFNEITNGRFKGKTWDALAEVTDLFGPRMTCTDSLEKAIDYAVETMKRNGLENVHTETVSVPYWERGFESAQLIEPWKRNMNILGLGTSIATPAAGILAEVVAYESFDEFEKVPEKDVKGKIVLFVPKWEGYGVTAKYRAKAASVASRKGAVAALVRSVTPFSLGTPHTGGQDYDDDVKKIPVAAVTVEDAEMLLRMFRRGQTIKIKLVLLDQNKPNCISRNTIGELQGSVFKNTSVVVVSGHFDSWDVGVGAVDDGGGVMISWKAVEFLRAMNLRPKRTIRAVLWTSEEQGLVGSQAYMKAHKEHEKEEFNFLMESDNGAFEPTGLDLTGNADAACILKEIVKLMKPLKATKFNQPADGAPDLTWWSKRGFPSTSLISKNENYFWYHHTMADTMTIWGSKDILDKATAIWAATAYVIADLSINIPKVVNHN